MRPSDVRLLFMGASIMSGWRSTVPELWARDLEPRGALNVGIPGETSGQLLWRIQHAGFLRGFSPVTTVLQIGANDRTLPAQDVAENIRDIVTASRAQMGTRIILVGIFPTDRAASAVRRKNDETNLVLRGMPLGEHVTFVDHGHVLVDSDGETIPALMPDGLHLSPAGYARWAQELFPLVGA